ncbi:MAG: tetratricopeptide repeat protein, partial [Planctomycetes bacterium]|nr:tetratricopeptide repeat protein [Planctomycetota bacterium]
LAGAFIVIHALAGRSSGAIVEPRGGGMAMNALLAVGNLATYGRLILFPVHLRPKYPSADPAALTTPHLLGAAAIAVALAALCVWSFARRDRRVIAFCLGWFLLNWLPVSSLVFPIGTAVAERYLQVPILGGYFLAAGALAVALRERRGSDHSAILERSLSAVRRTQSPAPQQANPPQADCTPGRGAMAASRSAVPRRLLALALAVLVAYCALSAQRGLRWQTGRSLWAEAVPISPDLADNYVGMGNAYMQAGQLDRAVRAFQAALGREPNSPVALHNLGLAYHRMGQLDEALVFYQRANQFSRPAEQDFSNIGIIYYEQGRYAEALAEYDKAIRARPDFAPAYHNLANALVRLDELDHAILAYGRAIQLDPDFGDAYLALGKACFTQGNLAVAIPAFQMAARLGPHSSEAHACLGVLLQTLGQPAAAKDQLRQSLALDPNVWQAHYLDGLIHEAEGALDRAADAYARSLSLNPHAEAVRERLEAIQGRLQQAGHKAK